MKVPVDAVQFGDKDKALKAYEKMNQKAIQITDCINAVYTLKTITRSGWLGIKY